MNIRCLKKVKWLLDLVVDRFALMRNKPVYIKPPHVPETFYMDKGADSTDPAERRRLLNKYGGAIRRAAERPIDTSEMRPITKEQIDSYENMPRSRTFVLEDRRVSPEVTWMSEKAKALYGRVLEGTLIDSSVFAGRKTATEVAAEQHALYSLLGKEQKDLSSAASKSVEQFYHEMFYPKSQSKLEKLFEWMNAWWWLVCAATATLDVFVIKLTRPSGPMLVALELMMSLLLISTGVFLEKRWRRNEY